MTNDDATGPLATPRRRLGRWLLAAAVALVVLEVLYVVAANAVLRSGWLADQINRKPEKMLIQWSSARTYLPGVVRVEDFSMRNQSRKVQFYMELREVRATISVLKLPFKTLRIRNANATDVDFRLRQRLDFVRPSETGSQEPPKPITGSEHFPEIPGLTNPPDPKPEDLYPRKKKRRSPWTIQLRGVDIDGDIQVAVDRFRLEGDGHVGGAMTYKLRDSIRIRKANLDLRPTRLLVDSEIASDDLELEVRSRWEPFPAKGAKVPQIVGGVSGSFAIRGKIHRKGTVETQIVPGVTTIGVGVLDMALELDHGALKPGTTLTLNSDDFDVRVMALDARGSATVTGATTRKDGADVTDVRVAFDRFSLVDASTSAVAAHGAGFTVDSTWRDLVLFGGMLPTSVAIELPRTDLPDVSVLGSLLPPQDNFSIVGGSGQVEASLSIDETLTAAGHIALDADEIDLIVRGVPMHADLAVEGKLRDGNLDTRLFEVSDTTVTLDNVVSQVPRESKREPEPWWCSIELANGSVVFSEPIAANGSVHIKMHDTAPVVAMINDFTKPPKWMSLMPNVKNVEGRLELDMGPSHTNFTDVEITGDKLELLGDLRVVEKTADGRIFARYGAFSAGIGLDGGKAKLHLAKPRKWFESGQ